MERLVWDNEVARKVYEFAWILLPIGIIAIIFLLIKYIKNKEILKADLGLEEEEKHNKVKILNKKYIILCIIIAIVSGVCFAGLRFVIPKLFSCSTLINYVEIPYGEGIKKPIIYLYPEQETEVTVKLKNPEKLACTYPKYENSWNVLAKPNGDLIDLNTGRNLYALYWEGINTIKQNEEEGFIVKGEDTIAFLEEKLSILGLTEREANEFIMYWLPQMEPNEYNFIRFATIEEVNENMPLEIYPKPDNLIRVMMEWKPLVEIKEIPEQKLITPTRDGFTVVEWGGSRIK